MRLLAGKDVARLLLLTLVAAGVASLAACGKGRLPLYPVKGKVLVDGKPAKDAFVNFHPKETTGDVPYVPYAQTDENGEFTLSTYVTGDGAPAGEYAITITWPERFNPISTLWEGDRLKGKYKDPSKPAFRIQVEKKPNELEPFKLEK